jgi:hypothetical protein
MSDTRTGGCLCGAVRYTLAWPPQALVVCHCSDCQKQAGSAFSVVGVSARGDIAVTGELTTFAHPGSSGQTVSRKFCGQCGSPVLTDTPAAAEQGIVFFKAGTLDRTDDLAPSLHYWTRSAQPWFALPQRAACLEQQ